MKQSLTRPPHDLEGFKDYIATHQSSIMIFGADIAGKVVGEILKKQGLSVSAYLDNNANKCDTTLSGVEVKHASCLNETTRDTVILIASTYISDIIHQIEGLGFYNWVPISGFLEEKKDENFEDYLEGELALNHVGGEFTDDFAKFVISNMVNSQKKYLDPTKLYIRSVDLIVTEKCSLKCKDCSNLMQYYDRPVNMDANELLKDLQDLCHVADEINEIRIIGGEPFMNKQAYEVIKQAASYPQVNKVVVYTNGTICPKDEQLLEIANNKTFIFITTYGALSRNGEKLAATLERLNIQHNIQAAYGWTDCADIGGHERSEEENIEIFRHCCAKHFTTLTDGRMFRCPFSANVERLQAIPEAPDDYVNIRGAHEGGHDLDQLKQHLRWFLREKPYIEACNSCNGRTYGDPEITPGIQTEKILSYQKYERP
ncbi:radical SAM protein [Terasakiella sp. SH-1]|uniref:radical SAM protein n=1 Tax=Terasakiella sp. SH-1 TaxID=2560057 RepID=UPI0010732EE2|nr:radical SAM protein [Terasakiella sp. SH-1]